MGTYIWLDPWLYPRSRRGGYGDGGYGGRGHQEPNPLEHIFSFVLGDGDPNGNYQQERWQAVGDLHCTALRGP